MLIIIGLVFIVASFICLGLFGLSFLPLSIVGAEPLPVAKSISDSNEVEVGITTETMKEEFNFDDIDDDDIEEEMSIVEQATPVKLDSSITADSDTNIKSPGDLLAEMPEDEDEDTIGSIMDEL